MVSFDTEDVDEIAENYHATVLRAHREANDPREGLRLGAEWTLRLFNRPNVVKHLDPSDPLYERLLKHIEDGLDERLGHLIEKYRLSCDKDRFKRHMKTACNEGWARVSRDIATHGSLRGDTEKQVIDLLLWWYDRAME